MAAFLGQVGGREIDGDPPRRERQAGGDQRRAHALAGLGHRLVRQADDGKGRQSRRDLHLHVDRAGLDPLKRDGRNPLNHARTCLPFCTIRGSRAGRSLQENAGTYQGRRKS